VIETPALADDRRFASALERWRHRRELDLLIAPATRSWDSAALMQRLQAEGVAAGAVNDAADMLRTDPQIAHRQHWVYLDHPEMGRTAYGAMPFRLAGIDLEPTSAAPMLGQHTDEICRDLLGLARAEIEQLHADGVLA
jgi:benzylsuccinate CoA-transferase BbsF subunit